jgi:phosphoserine phosphatase
MLAAAGLGVAYMAKPKVAAAADISITEGRLDLILQYFEIPSEDWIVVED